MANEWVRVDERPPEKPGYYLVTKFDYFDGWVTREMSWADGWNRSPGDNGEFEIGNEFIRAWMPMPEPYWPFTAEELRKEKMEEDARDVALEMGRDE